MDELLTGQTDAIWRLPNGTFLALDAREGPCGLLPGSFNPIHVGHRELRAIAQRLTGREVVFELSVSNVDKPKLDRGEINRRLRQLAHPVLLTNAPTFVRKAQIVPETTFVVGIDTAERIVDPKYYHGSQAKLSEALQAIRDHGCRFIVAGRCVNHQFHTLQSTPFPSHCADLFEPIPEHAFRCDISSTDLRDAELRYADCDKPAP